MATHWQITYLATCLSHQVSEMFMIQYIRIHIVCASSFTATKLQAHLLCKTAYSVSAPHQLNYKHHNYRSANIRSVKHLVKESHVTCLSILNSYYKFAVQNLQLTYQSSHFMKNKGEPLTNWNKSCLCSFRYRQMYSITYQKS